MAELADARDLKSLGPKARPGSIPGLGTNFRQLSWERNTGIHSLKIVIQYRRFGAKQTRGGAAW